MPILASVPLEDNAICFDLVDQEVVLSLFQFHTLILPVATFRGKGDFNGFLVASLCKRLREEDVLKESRLREVLMSLTLVGPEWKSKKWLVFVRLGFVEGPPAVFLCT